jgi:hypothetical protein
MNENTENKITHEEIEELIRSKGLTVQDVIDVVIDINGIIGVGLITLGGNLNNYCKSKIRKQ